MNPALRGSLELFSRRWRRRLSLHRWRLSLCRRGRICRCRLRVIGVTMMIVVVILIIVLVFARIMPLFVEDVLVFSDTFEVRLELALALALRQRTELHVDVTASHTRILIDVPHGQQVSLDLFGKQVTELLMRHLPATELKLNAHLVSFREEVFGMRDLDQIIMGVDADAEFHFLHLAALLVLVSLLFVLLLDVLVLAVVDDLAHGRIGVRGHLHQVQSAFFGDANGLRRGNDAELMMAVLFNNTHLRRTNALIDAGLIDKTTVGAIPATGTVAATTGAKRATTTRSLIASCGTSRSCGPRCSQGRPGWTRRRPRR